MVAPPQLIALNKVGELRNRDALMFQVIGEVRDRMNEYILAQPAIVQQSFNEFLDATFQGKFDVAIAAWALTGIAAGFSGSLSGDVIGGQFTTFVQGLRGIGIGTGSVGLANGANQDVGLPNFTHIRITGPTGAFSVGGLQGLDDGRVISLYNTTAQTMTINDEDAGSTNIRRIRTLTGGNVTLRAGATSAATLVYDLTQSRWILLSTN